MAYVVRMPKLGLEMEEGTLVEWHVEEGDDVSEEQLVAEIESEKSVGEVESREDGILRQIILEAGGTAAPGGAIGIIAEADEDISDLEAEIDTAEEPDNSAVSGTDEEIASADSTTEADSSTQSQTDVRASPRAEDRADELGITLKNVEGTGPGGAITEEDVEAAATSDPSSSADEVKASPRAEERAAELGIDLTRVEGTGPGGAITEEDVEGVADAASATDKPATRTVADQIEFGGMRQTIADRLSESAQNAVHVTEQRTVDAEEILMAVDTAEDVLDVEISTQDLLLLAVSATLDDHPEFNATYEDGTHTIYEEHNIGLAVDIDAGLISPVLPDVGTKQLSTIATDRRQLLDRALSAEYTMDDLTNGTFTISNLGMFGVEAFDPIINPPQIAILGVNAIQEQPERTDNGIEFRQKLPLSLSFDHRVVDGADAARFLQTLAEYVENPWTLVSSEVRNAREQLSSGGRSISLHSPSAAEGTVTAGSYVWSWGGDAPSPVNLFLGSLASCLSYFTWANSRVDGIAIGNLEIIVGTPADHGAVDPIEVVVDATSEAEDSTIRDVVAAAKRDCAIVEAVREDVPISVHLATDDDIEVTSLGRTATVRTTDGSIATITSDGHTWRFGADASSIHASIGSLAACLTYFIRDNALQSDTEIGTVDVDASTRSESGGIDAVHLEIELETTDSASEVEKVVENATQDCVVEEVIADSVPVNINWHRSDG